MLGAYWWDKIEKQNNEIRAFQASDRGGELFLSVDNDRIFIKGTAVIVVSGTLEI